LCSASGFKTKVPQAVEDQVRAALKLALASEPMQT
jgi:hypothetical protein